VDAGVDGADIGGVADIDGAADVVITGTAGDPGVI
jgi:hypothetical protein